jgi:beta-glucanase (GH16 family)
MELEYYTSRRDNTFLDGYGHLVIQALYESYMGSKQPYTSGRLNTSQRFEQTYGRFEARIKVPAGQGLWPAFWMLGANIRQVAWPACGEIDIMEMIGHQPGTLYGTLHGPGYSGKHGLNHSTQLPAGETFHDAYHVFAVEWTTARIDWLLDGKVYSTITPGTLPAGGKWVFDGPPFYLLLNLAVGGLWPGYPDATTTFPQEYRIDHVRVYRLE